MGKAGKDRKVVPLRSLKQGIKISFRAINSSRKVRNLSSRKRKKMKMITMMTIITNKNLKNFSTTTTKKKNLKTLQPKKTFLQLKMMTMNISMKSRC